MQKSGERAFQGAGTTSRCSKVGTSLATHSLASSLLLCVLFVCSYPCFTFQLRLLVKGASFVQPFATLHRASSQGHEKVLNVLMMVKAVDFSYPMQARGVHK